MSRVLVLLTILSFGVPVFAQGRSEVEVDALESSAPRGRSESKRAFFVIKDEAVSKYECRCFVWSTRRAYKLVHVSQGYIPFVEDPGNGGVIVNMRFNAKTQHVDIADIPWMEGKHECFNPLTPLKLTHEAEGLLLMTGNDSMGRDFSTWVQPQDLRPIGEGTPEFAERHRPEGLTAQQCAF